jgi:hypothetical protein
VEQRGTLQKLVLEVPDGVEYRSLGEAGEVPERFSVVHPNPPVASGAREIRLDLAWSDKAGKYDIVTVDIRARKGHSINLEPIRTLFLRIYRQASRQVVRARMEAVDGRDSTTLERVATIYRLAKAAGEAPTKAVAEQLGISRDAAAQQVSRARKADLLPPPMIIRRDRSPEARASRKEGENKNA